MWVITALLQAELLHANWGGYLKLLKNQLEQRREVKHFIQHTSKLENEEHPWIEKTCGMPWQKCARLDYIEY